MIKNYHFRFFFLLFCFILLLQIPIKAQTWSAVGNGLTANHLQVNYLFSDSNKYLIICTTVRHSPDTIPAWNGAAYSYPCEPVKYGFAWDLDTMYKDSVWNCVTINAGTLDFGTFQGDCYNWGYSGWGSHLQVPEASDPPITANAVNGGKLWFITSNDLWMECCGDAYTASAIGNHDAYCLMEYNNVLYVGGNIGGNPVITLPSNADWGTPPTISFSNSITKSGGHVYAMTFYNNQLFVGGDFKGHLALWDAIHYQWDTVTGIAGSVYALQSYNNKLYIGGKFTSVYQYNDTVLTSVGIIPVGDSIKTMAVLKDTLYVGGYFSNIDTIANTQNFAMLVTPYIAPMACSGFVATISSMINYKCGGNGNSVTVSAGIGTPPYTYLWSPTGGTLDSAINLSIGIYTVNVTDANGCKALASVDITQTPGLTAKICSITNIICNGENSGCAMVCASGGKPPYTYSWTPSGGTTQKSCNLTVGTYTVHVTDSMGCSVTAIATITQPPPFTIKTDSSRNVSCNGGNNGMVSITASKGTPPFTYSWTPNVGTNSLITNLTAGTYYCTITDSLGCIDWDGFSITITQPAVLKLTPVAHNISCNGANNGSVTTTVTGGTSPYTYSWNTSPIQTNANATGLSAGSYTLTVNDKNGCTATTSVIIKEPPILTASIVSVVKVYCYGDSNGSITAGATGGTGAYTYSWSTLPVQTSATATGLTGGTYTVTITDANGCVATALNGCGYPPPLIVSISSITNLVCNGGNTGKITAAFSGGTGPYTYTWTPTGGNGYTASNLTVGCYTFTVTDENGCSKSASACITEPTPLTISTAFVNNVSCIGGSNGSDTAKVSGGTAPYSYLWSGGHGTNTYVTGLSAGTYTLNVTDHNGCTNSATAIITQPAILSVSATALANVLCNTGNNGASSSIISGGTAPYTYSWSDANSQTTPSATGLLAGSYTVTVNDSCGNAATASVIITQPSAISITADSINDPGGCRGSAWANVIGGINPYSYLWTGGLTTDTINNQCAGSYCCVVTDANGCVDSVCVTINIFTGTGTILSNAEKVTIYPNPNNGKFIIELIGVGGKSCVEIYNMIGQQVSLSSLNTTTAELDLSSNPKGLYLYRVVSETGNLVSEGKFIIQ
jgi:hypothetical protein